MKYEIIENHRTEFPNPMLLKQGEKIIIGKDPNRSPDDDEKWSSWIFCIKIDGSNQGFVPEQIVKSENNYEYITEDYSNKELDIDIGTVGEGIKELNGWVWLKNESTKETGWVPIEKTKKMEEVK